MYSLNLIQYPSGRYGFVGNVPVELGYEMKDGSELDPEQVRIAQQCGPGFAKKLKGRSWVGALEALEEAKALGYNPRTILPGMAELLGV